MNLNPLLAVADRIEAKPDSFDMTTWGEYSSQCGTVACVAGCLVHQRDPRLFGRILEDDCARMPIFAAEILEIDRESSKRLFNPTLRYHHIDTYTIEDLKQYVPAALRWMVHNHSIDWNEAFAAVGAEP